MMHDIVAYEPIFGDKFKPYLQKIVLKECSFRGAIADEIADWEKSTSNGGATCHGPHMPQFWNQCYTTVIEWNSGSKGICYVCLCQWRSVRVQQSQIRKFFDSVFTLKIWNPFLLEHIEIN